MRLLKPVWVTHGFLSKDKAVGRPIYSLDIHPDGSRLATGGVIDTCGVVILWNMAPIRDPSLESDENSCLKLFQMDSHQACVNCVRWSPTGRWLASAGMDKVIMLWSKTAVTSRPIQVFGSKEPTKFTEHWRCVSTLRGHSGGISPNKTLHINAFLQSNTLKVDESGVEAAAVTSPILVPVSFIRSEIDFHVNQPFVCFIYDQQLAMPLLAAQVIEPMI
ncbi:unnamed protein product [Trichobilharzia szidati]|nr:unnamed protein product [Trichobilharzia szidati]